jgi:hypothetical protein
MDKLEIKTYPGIYDIFPVFSDRKTWVGLDENLREHIISDAEGLVGYNWPRFLATDYMEYYKEGSRKSWDRVFKKVFDPLTKLTMAECVEGKGRFLDDISNGIFARCEDTSWVHTGHLNHHGDEQIPRHDANYLDLRACSTASQLAHVYYLLKPQLDAVSPHICNRIEHEIQKRIINNYLDNDHWWTNLKEGGTINNWNTHCNKNVMRTALIIEKDPDKLKAVIEKSCKSLDVFLSIHDPDGACNEGPGYWKGAGFSYLTILAMLAKVYKIPVEYFLNERIRNMGSYIYKVIINGDYYMSYADGNGRNPMFDVKLFRIADALGDRALTDLARDTFRTHQANGEFYDYFMYILYDYLEYVMGYKNIQAASSEESEKKYYLQDTVLPDAHIASARQEEYSTKGFFTGIKGGHNDESHNHNDIGVFFLYYDGLPVVIDAGAGMYTIKTFGPDRYDIWTMQSQWHSLPEINGMGQAPGRKYRSLGFSHVVSGDESMCSMEITEAYPISIGLREFIRGYALNRDKEEVILHDSISLARPSSDIKWYLNLAYEPAIIDDGRIILNNGKTGILMEYDCGMFSVTIEKKDVTDDKKLSGSWGDAIYRLCMETKTKAEFHNINLRFIVLEEDCGEQ